MFRTNGRRGVTLHVRSHFQSSSSNAIGSLGIQGGARLADRRSGSHHSAPLHRPAQVRLGSTTVLGTPWRRARGTRLALRLPPRRIMKKLCPFLVGLLVYMGPSIPSACAESFAIQDGRCCSPFFPIQGGTLILHPSRSTTCLRTTEGCRPQKHRTANLWERTEVRLSRLGTAPGLRPRMGDAYSADHHRDMDLSAGKNLRVMRLDGRRRYSVWSAAIGSTRAARRAGAQQAIIATVNSTADVAA